MSSDDDAFLDAAAAIGRRIAADAVWHEGRCSWIGAVADEAEPWRAEYRALEAELYGGTAGVGLALARLAVATDDPALRRTALGAVRHAVARVRSLPRERLEGFHGGAPGVAWAAAEVGWLIGAEELLAGARRVIDASARSAAGEGRPDLVGGGAGSLVALLALAGHLDDAHLTERAVAIGEELLASATIDRHGWSWTVAQAGRRRLCGFAHGAAGIAWALLDLFAVTADGRFRDAALGGFAWDRSWLSGGAWPDLRLPGRRRGTPLPIESPAAGTWCHGEAGIALARLRGIAVLGPGPHADDAEVALAVTRRRVEADPTGDLSLCHGAGGAADVLLCAAAALGGEADAGASLAADLGRAGLERHADTGDWQGGVPGGTTPGLFLGLAGIAWLLLRLQDRSIASPLAMPAATS